jgi:sec-independent protein translocase protein TatC
MATEPEENLHATQDEEEAGGPVKTFLEHLEDLRWTLLKVFSSLLLAMLACLVGGNYLVKFLEWPLEQAMKTAGITPPDRVVVKWETNILGRLERTNLSNAGLVLDTNINVLKLRPVTIGSNILLALEPQAVAGPVEPGQKVQITVFGPLSGFMVGLKLALYGGLVISLPFIIYFIGQFVLPAMKVKEKEFVLRAGLVGIGLFLLGAAFCYFVLLKVALIATMQFAQWLGFTAELWRAEEYITFVCFFLLAVGISFELPVVILSLVKIGILDYEKLNRFRSFFVVGELVVCAFLTPSGDPFTMLLMAAPMHVLFEISVLISWYWHRRDQRKAAEQRLPRA